MSADRLQIDVVYHWAGSTALPDQLRGDGPWSLTLADIERLMADHDVMLRCEAVTIKRGAPAETRRVLWLDTRGGKFKQR